MGLTREQRMNRTACVYFIRDPETMQIRYIGCSVRPKVRKTQHLSINTNPKLYFWSKALMERGKRPVMDIIFRDLPLVVAERVEHRLIVKHSNNGLLQLTYRIENGKEVRNLGGNTLYSYMKLQGSAS